MVRGLYTSTLGMTTQMKKMDVVSNNIANADTTGFKKDTVITQSFTEQFMKRLDDKRHLLDITPPQVGGMTLGLAVNNVATDFSKGALKRTEGTYDIAIDGQGFFAVSTTDANGDDIERYTRDGTFTLTSENVLVTSSGDPVVGTTGNTITIPNTATVAINGAGEIYADGTYIDKIKIVDFENKDSLRKFGDNLYDVTEESVEQDFTGKIIQGSLEVSNVNSMKEMVDMITLNRVYEANQRAITSIDSTLQRTVNDLAKK